ncbi:MAG: hypothetical protein Q8L78_03800 [Coxiellaceae bacterium]|nr:hypothetical protein [Coxiellaceae bacterium]
MKKTILNIVLLGILAGNIAQAEDLCAVIGFYEPGTHTYDGPTFCQQVSINDIVVRGPLNVSQSVITGIADISGPINAAKTEFNKIISEDNGSHEKITLKQSSVVDHDVIFEGSKPGSVEIDQSSKINGKVVNGTITHI